MVTFSKGITGVGMIVGVGLLAVYISYPRPSMSANLLEWMTYGKYFDYKGHLIFYRDDKGSAADDSVLVCLHGFPSFSYDWTKVWPHLRRKFSRVIALDFIGFGLSVKPKTYNYTIVEQATIVNALLQKLSVKKVHLLAHDYGDTVAQELLARYNNDETKDAAALITVCLSNGGIFPETHYPRPLQKVLLIPYLKRIVARLGNFFLFKKGFGEVFGPKTQPTYEEFKDFWAGVTVHEGHLVLPDLLDYIPQRKYNRKRWTEALQKSKVPVHVIYGPSDPVNPPGFINFYKKTVPGGSITVLADHISHYPQWEDPVNFMKGFSDFLSTVTPQKTKQN